MTAKAQHLLWETPPKLTIIHNALTECFKYTMAPENAVDSAQLLRIAAGIKLQTLRYYAGSEKRHSDKQKIQHDEAFSAKVEVWRNPIQTRPGLLLHTKRRL